MSKCKIHLNDKPYIVNFDTLSEYPDFMLVVCLGAGETVLSADAAFSLEDQREIALERCLGSVGVGRIRPITFNKSMALLGKGLPYKNGPILDELVKLKFLTKEEMNANEDSTCL